MAPIEFAQDLYTAENIYDTAGRLLIKAGATLTGRVCDLLRNNGIFSVYVNDVYSTNLLIPPIFSDLKVEIVREMMTMYEIIRLRFE